MLLVDDDRPLLDGLRRQLRGDFSLEVAVGGHEGLERLRDSGPYAVVLSDYRMPEMNGAAFLAAVRRESPTTTRMLLTGHTDIVAAADAVNSGQVFRLLLKPIQIEGLVQALRAGIDQHELVVAERELLRTTLRGSVQALIQVLSLADPSAFGRATRIHRLAVGILQRTGQEDRWDVEMVVMLSQIGAIALPPQTLDRLERGDPLTAEESAAVERLPALADQMLADVPRLEQVRTAILLQAVPARGPGGEELLPLGARVLRVVSDFDRLESSGLAASDVVHQLRQRHHQYDVNLLDALADLVANDEQRVLEVNVADLTVGATLASDVYSAAGVKLVAREQDVTIGLMERMRNYAQFGGGIREPLIVFADDGDESED